MPALKGRGRKGILKGPLIPNEFLLVVNSMLFQKVFVLFLKRNLSMMLFLLLNITHDGFNFRLADGKTAITPLPIEIRNSIGLHFLGRTLFDFLNQLRKRKCSGETTQNVNVVFRAADLPNERSKVFQNSGHVGVRLGANFFVEKRVTALGAKDNMHPEF
jgi:hypothetical protein